VGNTVRVGAAPAETRVVLGELHRIRQGRERRFVATLPKKAVPLPPRPVKAAMLLALAHRVEREIDAGTAKNRADIARKLGISRARITQILDLTLLSTRIQEAVLSAETLDGREPITERALREVLRYDSWALQEAAWAARPKTL
jgi:ParB-like chromosome segregation protein Spo0J